MKRDPMAGLAALHSQELRSGDRVYCCLPLYHTAGGVMAAGAALLSGGSLVIARKFSAKRFWSDCAQHEVTSIQYIGELCRYLLNSPPHPDERAPFTRWSSSFSNLLIKRSLQCKKAKHIIVYVHRMHKTSYIRVYRHVRCTPLNQL